MNWIGIVSASAAGLAAILAAVNLYISDRRELNKWTRESLIETLTVFLDASFRHASACRKTYSASPDDYGTNKLRRAILAAHEIENSTLTRLRILAPPSVVQAAIKLLEVEYHLAEPCFRRSAENENSLATYYQLIDSVHEQRQKFIQAARASLGLRHTSGTGIVDRSVRWSTLRELVNEAENP
jgi:hypothetical protein